MAAFKSKFVELNVASIDDQCSFFTKRFVFALGDQFSDVVDMAKEYKVALEADKSGDVAGLSAAGAAGFLQKHGKTRTALQRAAEIKDIDFDSNGKISFIEYCLLHYKVMILKEHFARLAVEPSVDLSEDGVGLTGVGALLIEELFQPPAGLDPELESMMREFSLDHAKRDAKIKVLEAKVEAGGVKGMAAKNELDQLKAQGITEMNAVETKIANAIKKAQIASAKELKKKETEKADAASSTLAAGRSKMADKMAMFNKGKDEDKKDAKRDSKRRSSKRASKRGSVSKKEEVKA